MPSLIRLSGSDRVESLFHDICASCGWILRDEDGGEFDCALGAVEGIDAVVFDCREPWTRASELAGEFGRKLPFLPLIFLQAKGIAPPESVAGLRYYVDAAHLDDLQHILISLSFGFLSSECQTDWPESSSSVPRILIVDDNVQLASLIGHALRSMERFDVRIAVSGYEAASILPGFHPDVAVVDLVLGDIDGRTVCALIRQHGGARRTHILGVSGYLPEERIGEERVFDDYLEKPFRVKDVLERIMPYLATTV